MVVYCTLGRGAVKYLVKISSVPAGVNYQVASPTSDCLSIIINNLLLLFLVVSMMVLCTTNQLFSLTGEGSGRRWTEEFPPMPTK
jgi:hypothetical protein